VKDTRCRRGGSRAHWSIFDEGGIVSHRIPGGIAAAAAAVLGLVLTGCGGAGAPPVESPTPAADADHFSGFLDVGGNQLWTTCSGSGSPTIILEAGDEADHTMWLNVYPRLKEETHVCMYDRLGLGKSDDATGCRGLADLNGDLAGVLDSLGEAGPYIRRPGPPAAGCSSRGRSPR
jgi:hypothetical protein